MLLRTLEESDVRLSQIAFGSMRFDPKTVSAASAVKLLRYMYESGVTTFHSSDEYPFHDYFCEQIALARQSSPSFRPAHIVKIPEPHYGVEHFSKQRFLALIDRQLGKLGADRIDVVQWQLRYRIEHEDKRQSILLHDRADIAEAMDIARRDGKVGAFMADPYTKPFAEKVLGITPVRGLVTYLNLLEVDFAPLLRGMARDRQGWIAIRPFAAGWLTPEGPRDVGERAKPGKTEQVQRILAALEVDRADLSQLAVRFPLMHPNVISLLVSMNSRQHVDDVLRLGADYEPNPDRFWEIVERMRTVQTQAI